MPTSNEHFLLVESDPEICDLISHQALLPLGYQVVAVSDATKATQDVIKFTPDLIFSNINLPGLSGKDLIVALTSQGFQTLLIVIAEKEKKNDDIQAFRLGADDYLLWLARDVEVVSVVERSLRQTCESRNPQKLDIKLKEVNQASEQRVCELTTIFAVGKAVLSIRDQAALLDKLVEIEVYVKEADFGWLLLLKEKTKGFELVSHRKLPEFWVNKLGKTLDDGISSMVGLSGETLAINGIPLKQFKVANLGQSAASVPINMDNNMAGLLVIVSVKNIPNDQITQSLLEAVADYALISLVNTLLLFALKEFSDSAWSGENRNSELRANMQTEVKSKIQPVTYPIEFLQSVRMGTQTDLHQQVLIIIREAYQLFLKSIETVRQTLRQFGNGKYKQCLHLT